MTLADAQARLLRIVWIVACSSLTSCSSHVGTEPILLFDGAGASHGSVAALRSILEDNHLAYATVGSGDLDKMDESALRRHRLLIMPGGDFVEMGNGISKDTAAHIRNSVQHGLSYFGVCAGAFFAGASPYNGLNLTSGAQFHFYSIEEKGVRKAAVWITSADGTKLEHYWQDGPQLNGWGEVVAKYPDGTPAVVQGSVGNGWVILTGMHAEATERWRYGMSFTTSVSADNKYAAQLIHAALERRALVHF